MPIPPQTLAAMHHHYSHTEKFSHSPIRRQCALNCSLKSSDELALASLASLNNLAVILTLCIFKVSAHILRLINQAGSDPGLVTEVQGYLTL
jgi:hypothetical protein